MENKEGDTQRATNVWLHVTFLNNWSLTHSNDPLSFEVSFFFFLIKGAAYHFFMYFSFSSDEISLVMSAIWSILRVKHPIVSFHTCTFFYNSFEKFLHYIQKSTQKLVLSLEQRTKKNNSCKTQNGQLVEIIKHQTSLEA